jgi:hypothetical protein
MWILAAGMAAAAVAAEPVRAQVTVATPSSAPGNPIALVDSNGNVAARPLNETLMLVALGGGVVAPAVIRPIYDADGRAASALATWHSGGSVLFTSADCTTGAHLYSPAHPGVRAASQVKTEAGIVLYVGAVGPAITTAIQSILYDTGCARVAVAQNGLVPVVATVNLTTVYPPPLSFK